MNRLMNMVSFNGKSAMSHTFLLEPEIMVKEPLEVLTKLLAAYPDLQTTLSEGFRFILEATKRTGGMLVIQGPDDTEPLFSVVENPPHDWNEQLTTPNSMLRMFCRSWIEPSGLVITEDPYSPVIIYPLTNSLGQQGIMLLEGQEASPQEKEFLIKAGQSLGHSVNLGRSGSILFEMSKLLDTLELIVSGLDPKASLEESQMRLISSIRDSLRCEAGSIAMLDESQGEVVVKKTLISGTDWIYQVSMKMGEGLLGECLQVGKVILSNNPSEDERYDENFDSVPGLTLNSLLCVPLVEDGKVIGILAFQNKRDGDFTLYDQQLLSTLAKSIVHSLVSLQTIQQMRVLNAHLEASRWELVQSRNTLRSLFDNLPDSLYIVDRAYHLIAINTSRSNRVSGNPREMVGKLCYESLYGRSEPCQHCQVAETFYKKKVTHRTDRQWENMMDPMEWEVSTYPIMDESDEVTQAILVEKDVTEKRRLEGFLAQSEKMAAVGELAAGIAHEINNPLTVILANAQLLQRELPADQDWYEMVDLIHKAGTRALYSVRNLLNFARKEQFEFAPTDINNTVERALEMSRHELVSHSVELVFEPGENLPLLPASANHLQGVWLNLIINGIDAIDKQGGKIKVSTFRQGNDIRVCVSDNGQGISPDALKRIFEPFYTTKDPDRGTGLGLSVCHRVIKQHGGLILVDSQVGKGTTFTVVLPMY